MGWIESNTSHDPVAEEGMRIRIIHMDDDNGVDEGMEGTITKIDSLGTIHVRWDDGRQLGVIYGIDDYQLLPKVEDQTTPDNFMNLFGESKLTSNLKKDFKTSIRKNGLKIKVENIEGGTSDDMTPKDLAKKHGVDVKDIKKEIKVGTKIELEHTDSEQTAREIAMDHITEFPDYYSNKKYGTISSEKGLESIHENKITLKDEVERILNTIKTAKPIHRESLENMVNNLVNKYKNIKKDEKKFYYLIERLKTKISDKFDLEETTTTGSLGSTPIQPLGNPIGKEGTKKTSNNVTTKGDVKNPLGKVYYIKKENHTFKVGDLLKEISSTHASKLRDAEGTFDGDPWVGKKGWLRREELVWEGGEIADIMAKLNINWSDSDLTLSDKETDAINESKKESAYFKFSKGSEEGVIVVDLGSKNHTKMVDYLSDNGFKMEKISKKEYDLYDKGDEMTISETTTFSSVFGGDFPVTPFMFAKKGKHVPSKKTLWKGGKIVQKIDRADVLGESILDEINKVKWVKGGKYVKIKDRCAKYNNKSWCSQGALDNPLELSDTTFESIKKVSEKTGLSERKILERIKIFKNGKY